MSLVIRIFHFSFLGWNWALYAFVLGCQYQNISFLKFKRFSLFRNNFVPRKVLSIPHIHTALVLYPLLLPISSNSFHLPRLCFNVSSWFVNSLTELFQALYIFLDGSWPYAFPALTWMALGPPPSNILPRVPAEFEITAMISTWW